MSRSIKRKIRILNNDYYWVLDGNSLFNNKEQHIRIYSKELTKSTLYLDPYNWDLEIRPKTIETAILFAIEHGWDPKVKGKQMYLSMKNEGELFQLPNGAKFGYLYKNK